MQKKYNTGDIVYWCHQCGNKYEVHWGMVDEQFSDAVCIDYLHIKEHRVVNGIPFNEFESETRVFGDIQWKYLENKKWNNIEI